MHHYDGHILTQRREDMGLTIEEVFDKIRIPIAYLRHLESGNLAALPPLCYTQGFLRSYCRFLGIDADPLVRAYDEAVRPPERAFLQRTSRLYEALAGSTASSLVAWAVVCALIALGWATYAVVVQPNAAIQAAPAYDELVVPQMPGAPTGDF